jgi:hypothetical protein
MKTIDKIFALLGIIVGALLLAYTYYANAHGGVSSAMQNVYLLLFFPSFGLIATDSASPLEQIIVGVAVVAANGVLYGVICIAIHKLVS